MLKEFGNTYKPDSRYVLSSRQPTPVTDPRLCPEGQEESETRRAAC